MLKQGTKVPLFKAWMHRDCEVSNPITINQFFNTLSDIICRWHLLLTEACVFYVHSYFRYLFVMCTVTSGTCLLCAKLLQVPVCYVHSYFRYLFVMCTVTSGTFSNLMKKWKREMTLFQKQTNFKMVCMLVFSENRNSPSTVHISDVSLCTLIYPLACTVLMVFLVFMCTDCFIIYVYKCLYDLCVFSG